MIRRTVLQWRELFNEQIASGLTAAAFCREKQLCPRYFSKRRKQLMTSKEGVSQSTFIKTKAHAISSPAVSMDRIALRTTAGDLSLPANVEPEWLATLMKALR